MKTQGHVRYGGCGDIPMAHHSLDFATCRLVVTASIAQSPTGHFTIKLSSVLTAPFLGHRNADCHACAVLRQHRSTQKKTPRGRADEAALTADTPH